MKKRESNPLIRCMFSVQSCLSQSECDNLNRMPCTWLSNACGPCKEGFVSESGEGPGISNCVALKTSQCQLTRINVKTNANSPFFVLSPKPSQWYYDSSQNFRKHSFRLVATANNLYFAEVIFGEKDCSLVSIASLSFLRFV